MDPRRRAAAMVVVFVGLLAFHVWLLYRMVSAANWLLAALLLVAIGMFGWRIDHYANLYRGVAAGKAKKEPAKELHQIRVMAPVLAALLVLHAWLISLTLAAPDSTEKSVFLALLFLAVVTFVVRLGFYVRRSAQFRRV